MSRKMPFTLASDRENPMNAPPSEPPLDIPADLSDIPVDVPSDIMDLTHAELSAWLTRHGAAPYRAGQILRWVYLRQADRFSDMTDLGRPLRELMEGRFSIRRMDLAGLETALDGTRKFLFRLGDGAHIESVLIPEKDHYTLCVSSQVGCAQGCRFCLTARNGLTRNLRSGEILAQVRDVGRHIAADDPRSLSNIVFMGMGEPLANYAQLIRALGLLLNGDYGMKFSSRRVTVSTCGLVPFLRRLGEDSDVNLAISLNGADDVTRGELMPVNRKYPLAELMAACQDYPLSPRRRITFEYILMRGINDASADARRLAGLLHGVRSKVNLIPFNEFPGAPFRRPDEEAIAAFQRELTDRHLTAVIRYSKGLEISAACGQLRAKVLGDGLPE